MRRCRCTVVAAAMMLAACGSSAAPSVAPSPETTASPPAPAPSSTEGSATTSTSVAASSPSTSATTVEQPDPSAAFDHADLPAGPCSLGQPPATGETTFLVGSRLYGVDASGTLTCVADLGGRSPEWLSWSPDGDEVLVGPDVLLRADGTFTSTGYFADNTNVRWSAPTGKALLAPKAATGELIWRNAHDSTNRIDVSFADQITSAAYHPAGKHIAAAGVGRDGLGMGLFVASNRGDDPQRIGLLDEGTTVSQIAFDMNGDSVVFVHEHPGGESHLHRFDFRLGMLQELVDLDVAPSNVTVSPVDQGDVAWSQGASTEGSTVQVLVAGATAPETVHTGSGSVSEPIGWLPGDRLLVGVRAGGQSDAAFDLWEWSPAGTTKIIDDVTAAAARTVHGAFNELTIIPGSGFG